MAGVRGLVGRHLGRLGAAGGLLELGRAGGQLGLERGRGLLELLGRLGQQVGPHRGARRPLLERPHPAGQRLDVVLLPGRGPGHQLGAGPDPGDRLVRRVGAQDRRPAVPQRRLLLAQGRQRRLELGPLLRAARRLLGLGRGQLGGQAGRLGLEGRDHVDVGGGVERGDDGPPPLAQQGRRAPGPLDQALHPAERVGQVLLAARRQLGGGGGGLGVELLERLVQLALLVPADGQALRGRPAAGRQVGQLGAGQVAAHGQQLGGHRVVRAGGRGLALEGADLAPHLAHQVAQALEVLGRGGQAALGPLAAPAVLEHPGRLLDDGPAVLGAGVEHGVELALADDHVLLAAHARVAQQLLDVEQPAGRPVDGVLAVARAEQRPGDGDLGQVDGQLARGVVDGERHLGPAQLGTRRGPGEDDVLHLGRAQRAGPLGAEHPGHGVDDVGLAAPVGADDHRDPGLELQHGRVGEGLEALHAERLQEHRGDPTGCLRGCVGLKPGSARRRRSSGRRP